MKNFSRYQYDDLLNRQADVYANAKYQIILGYLANRSGLKILNVGCGSGELSFLLAQAGHTVAGIDPAPEYIALANKNLPSSLVGQCSFQVGSLEDCPSDYLYDAVVAADVLEHISDDQAAAEKLARLVRPGGSLIITVPAMPGLFGFHDEQLGHFRRYRASQLKRLITGTGLIKIKTLRYFGFTLIPVCLWYSKIWRRNYPLGPSSGSRLRGLILRILLTFDKLLPLPFGTSLILYGVRGTVDNS